MKCLLKYQWVKLSRAYLPQGKGLMGYWAKLASRAAFRKGHALYCGYKNEVIPGMWSGGIVGLKSILGLKSRAQALEIMNELSALGYISYSLDPKTKKLTYQINDWVVKCSGAECSEGTVYASDGYGFICLPRDITQRLADSNRKFSESDAWLDLWCHTVWQDSGNIFSLLAPTVQFERRKALLTLETMGQRWKWEKTKVWRFFQKYNIEVNMVTDIVALYVMQDDAPLQCCHYYCSAAGESDRTEVYVVPRDEFAQWLILEKTIPEEGVKLYEECQKPPQKHM